MKRTYFTILMAIMLLLAPLCSAVSKVSAAPTPKTALIYGDSITFESLGPLTSYFATKSGWTSHYNGFPGTAVCDWLPLLSQDIITYNPSIVSIETAGNTGTPCMQDANGQELAYGTPGYYAKYRADLSSFFATATNIGAKVVFITAPPMHDPTWNAAVTGVSQIATQLAASYPNVSVSATPRNSVSSAGTYQAYKPCLSTEKADMGCTNGQIAVRTISGIQTGIHLCPAGLATTFPFACATYSSGEYRFGRAIVNAVIKPPAPIRPTVVMASVTGVEGASLAFKPTLLYPYSRDLVLCYNTTDGSATASDGDYTPMSGCFTIPAWTTTGPIISVQTILDSKVETNKETFKFSVTGLAVPIKNNTKTVTGGIKANGT